MRNLSIAVTAFVSLATHSAAQCPGVTSGFGDGGLAPAVFALHAFDAGNGEELYAGGNFVVAGDAPALRCARWDGAAWRQVGAGFDYEVRCFATHQGELYAGGEFTSSGGTHLGRVARYDGTQWQPVGSDVNSRVFAMVSFGGELVIGGSFTDIGGVNIPRVARWNGSSWSPMGAGFTGAGKNVHELAVIDLGAGPELYAGGAMNGRVQRWTGSAWTPVGAPAGNCWALAAFDAGQGPELYGGFTGGGGMLARWTGTTWAAIPGGPIGTRIADLVVHDAGSGRALFAGGGFYFTGGFQHYGFASWDGVSWGHPAGNYGALGDVHALALHDDGSGHGDELWLGGEFKSVSDLSVTGVAAWDGATWRSPAREESLSFPGYGYAHALESWTSPVTGRELVVVGGAINSAGALAVQNVAAHDGVRWLDLGGGTLGEVYTLEAALEPASGEVHLYAGGYFLQAGGVQAESIARFDGSAWHPLGLGLNQPARNLLGVTVPALGGPALIASGFFTYAGGQPAQYIARFDGTQWHPLGDGLNSMADALVVWDDPSTPEGPELFAGGNFNASGTLQLGRCARWDGTTWRSASAGLPADIYGVHCLALWDDGSGAGERLYAQGLNSGSGPDRLYVRNAGVWSLVGDGPPYPWKFVVHDDGAGETMFAGYQRWNGSAWTNFATPLGNFWFEALLSVERPGGDVLWMAGDFFGFDGVASRNVARFADPCAALASYCTAKTNSQGCVPPIGWSGEPAISQLATTPFVVTASQVINQKTGRFFYSLYGRRAAPFQGGTLCTSAPVKRTPYRSSGGNVGPADCSGVFAIDFSAWLDASNDPAIAPGVRLNGQWWYRDPASPSTTGLSDALELEVRP